MSRIDQLRARAALTVKKTLAPILYRHRPIGLSAGKLYLYLDSIYRTAALTGAVVEIGCNVCGTSAIASQMLRKMASQRPYLCIDTFGGFVPEQHAADVARGNSGDKRMAFSANDITLARRVLELHGGSDVELLQADVCALEPERLPEAISVCLIDVDLYEPVLAALDKVYPRLEPGGFILVDDIKSESKTWRAGDALKEFVGKTGAPHRIEFGMAVIEKPRRAAVA